MSRVVEDHKTALHYTQRLQALHTGEAGLDDTIAMLRGDEGFPGFGPTDFGYGEYESTVSPGPADDQRRIEVRGYFPSRLGGANDDYQQRILAAIVRLTPEEARFALKGRSAIRSNGDLRVDCYDSSLGPYPNVMCPEGDVLGNQSGPNTLRVDGDTVMGERRLFCEFGCPDPETAITIAGARDDGGKFALSDPYLPIPSPTGNGNKPLTVPPGETVSLAAGEYEYKTLVIGEDGQLLGVGPPGSRLILRIKEEATLEKGARLSYDDLPTRLELIAADVTMEAGSLVYGTIVCGIGKKAGASLFEATGNPQVFGQLECDKVEANSAGLTVHYDRQLPADGANGNAVTVQLWRRDPLP